MSGPIWVDGTTVVSVFMVQSIGRCSPATRAPFGAEHLPQPCVGIVLVHQTLERPLLRRQM
jgi:hypothetical protein